MSSRINFPTGPSLQSEKSRKQEFIAAWRGRALYSVDFSSPKVHYVALRTLAVLTAAAAITFIALSLCNITVVCPSVIIPLSVLVSIFSFMRASFLHYHLETKARETLRKEIAHLTLKEIIREYSWKQIFSRGIVSPEEFAILYRQQVATMTILQACKFHERAVQRLADCHSTKHIYHIPLLSELREKWEEETEEMSFEDIIAFYPIVKLHECRILSEREFALLSELKKNYQVAKNERDRDLIRHFPELEARNQVLEKGREEIEAVFRNDPALRRIESIAAEYNAKRDGIINRYAQLVRQELDAAYAPYREYLERHSKQYLHWIKKEHREECRALQSAYGKKKREINARLERSRNTEIAELEESYGVERLQLSAEVEAAKARYLVQINELQAKIERAFDERIEERFRNLAKDLNAQFAARRYLLKVGS